MSSSMTPEKLTEAFFEFKGWKWLPQNALLKSYYWYDSDGSKVSERGDFNSKASLPPLHHEFEGLGLQEQWLWPELREKDFDMVRFLETAEDGNFYQCAIWDIDRGKPFVGEAKTKAIAQLTAGLPALGVKI